MLANLSLVPLPLQTPICCIQEKVYRKSPFSFQSQRKAMPKNAQTTAQLSTNYLISHASKVMLKILQARLQQYMNQELLDVHAGYRKGRGTRDRIANIHWIIEKARKFH